jgi:hypothetical protein
MALSDQTACLQNEIVNDHHGAVPDITHQLTYGEHALGPFLFHKGKRELPIQRSGQGLTESPGPLYPADSSGKTGACTICH